jgi:hypothetical protein
MVRHNPMTKAARPKPKKAAVEYTASFRTMRGFGG